ncbi:MULTISPECIES: hypothetical protein [Paraburkholderia]|uniref:Uncharacterized protein n=1 Tax=Paraburkholderia youngii TaxID=2782701 RepID=A0A7Y6K7R1_9BURK|nr:hypothetical protein [Paraburkholderia youngii]NUY05003.1 hypothetical protein [Paraburkholderia youngii]
MQQDAILKNLILSLAGGALRDLSKSSFSSMWAFVGSHLSPHVNLRFAGEGQGGSGIAAKLAIR